MSLNRPSLSGNAGPSNVFRQVAELAAGPYVMNPGDDMVMAGVGGTQTVTLPSNVREGDTCLIVAAFGNVTVLAPAGQTVQAAASQVIAQGNSLTVTFDGINNWAPSGGAGGTTGVISVVGFPGVDPTGVANSAAGFQLAFNTGAAQGLAVYIPPGTYLISTPVTLPSNLEVIGCPGAIINSNTPGGGLGNSTFLTVVPTQTSATTLAANNVVGTNQISSTATIAKGQIISIASVLTGVIQYFTAVANPSGVGPFTITLDRPVLRQFVTNDVIKLLPNQPTNILWHGHGMLFKGVATAYVLFQGGALNCLIEDCNAQAGLNNDVVFPFISGSLRCHGLRLRCDGQGAGPPSAVLGFSSAEDCTLTDCAIWNAVNGTILYKVVDSIRCKIKGNSSAAGAGTGVAFGTDTGQAVGCIKCSLEGGHFDGCSNGVEVGANCDGTILTGFTANYATAGFGIQVDANSIDTTIANFEALGNHTSGLVVVAGANGVKVVNGILDFNVTSAMNLGDSVDIQNINATCLTGSNSGVTVSGGLVRIANSRLKHPTGGAASFFVNVTAGVLMLVATEIQLGVTGDVGTQIAGAATVVHAVGHTTTITDGATGTIGHYSPASGTYRIGPNCENNAATPVTLAGSGRSNRKQTFVANGVTGVAVAFQDMKANDLVLFTLQTIGGTVGHPKYTVTAGTGFTFTSDAADTSTYEWSIP